LLNIIIFFINLFFRNYFYVYLHKNRAEITPFEILIAFFEVYPEYRNLEHFKQEDTTTRTLT